MLPPPSVVFAEIGRLLWGGSLLLDLWASLRRILVGFSISVVISVVIGALMARSVLFEDMLDPIIELIRPVSPLAIFPLALLWFGIGDGSKIFLIALSCSFPIILSTYAGVRGIDRSYIRVARSLGANQSEILAHIILKGCLPQLFTGIRVAWGIALIVIIASEMIGGVAGLGYMVLTAQETFRVDRVFAGIVVIGVLGFSTDQAFRALRRRLLPWYQELRE
ncbi:MAG TPA: ABC transporter permease [Candidatus Sulfotelmatobacter sp.]|nr:ABC transporter permease [Candidatus Sulfotelmatobacter sp.]